MSRPDRVIRVVLASLLAVLGALGGACGGPPSSAGASCNSDEECRPDARCSSGSCILNSPPVASFAIAGDLETSALVTLDGSASRDPDQGDSVASYAWRIDADGAPCEPPLMAGTSALVRVRFGCAGRFRVQLVVRDGKLVESAPASRAIDIAPGGASAVVRAGPDQMVDHLCAGTPLLCRTRTAVQLTATTTATAPVSLRWTVQPPPGRELDAHRRVRFVPDASAQNPAVEIETDGAAISGDWLFQVEVRDAIGVLDADVTRVSVANHGPAIRGGPSLPFAHAFDASTRRFTSSGAFPVEVTDEDGDPVVREVAFHHSGDGGAPFTGEDLGAAIRFEVSVAYGASSDALFLRGGASLERSVVVTATDVNGSSSTSLFAVQIGDQPPGLYGGTASLFAANHSYDPSARVYLAQPTLGRGTDPDGDPLTYVVAADPVCPTFGVDGDGTVRLRCSSAFTSVGSLEELLGKRKATVVVSDPWQSVTSTPTFSIGDNPPTVTAPTYRAAVECRQGFGVATVPKVVSVPLNVADLDGDPVEVVPTAGGRSVQCLPGLPCTMPVTVPELHSWNSTLPDVTIPIASTDGHAATSGSIVVSPECR